MTRHGAHPAEIVPPRSSHSASGRFGRMFGHLPPFASDTPEVRAALLEIGAPGGIMDARDDDPGAPADSARNSDNPSLPAGFTFLGQFIGHDMTADPTSSLERQADPEQIANFRTPSLGLDNVYGAGPASNPHFYDVAADIGGKFLLEPTGTPDRFDVPRNSQNVALVADPRDDENLITAQLHVAMLKFHNRVADHVKAHLRAVDAPRIFSEAQRIVRWHYQWIIVHEYLRKTCGDQIVDDILANGRKFYNWRNEPFIPVEFSVAAFRFGHSQVRPTYRANLAGDGGNPFVAVMFGPASNNPSDPDDLSGGCRAPRRFVDWQTFFDFGDGNIRPNKKIDTTLSTTLFQLPGSFIPNPDPTKNPASLAQRNLLRHLTFSLPSGQRVARAMSMPELSRGDLDDLRPYGLDDRTPLWFYILREAQLLQSGERLGPVGARIVAEVIIGMIEGDASSYLASDPAWQPFLPTIDGSKLGDDFHMIDLLRFAEVA